MRIALLSLSTTLLLKKTARCYGIIFRMQNAQGTLKKICWYCYCSNTDISQMHMCFKVFLSTLYCLEGTNQIVLTFNWDEIKQSWWGSYSFSISFLTKHHSSNRKFAPLDTRFLVNPEKSQHFRDVHLGQTFCSYNTQTTPVTGILAAHYKPLIYKTVTPSPFAYIIGPQTLLHECLLTRLWLLREYHWA